jgi:AcrR family transcriptional regulator
MSTLSEQTRQGRSAAPGRREAQRLETVRLVKDAALRLFLSQGFDATTTKQIAEAAGVAQGTVFLVAPSKEGLLVTVLEEELRAAFAAHAPSVPKRGIEKQLLSIVGALFDFFAVDPALSRALFRAMTFFTDPVARDRQAAHVGDFLRVLADLFEQAKARKEVAPRVDAAIAAANVFAIYVHAATMFLNEETPDRAALDARFKAQLAGLLRGVLTTRG